MSPEKVSGIQENRTRLLSVIGRAAALAVSEDFAQKHYSFSSDASRRGWDGILGELQSNTRWIVEHFSSDREHEALLSDSDERVTAFYLAGSTLILPFFGMPQEAADRMLRYAQINSHRLIREEAVVLLEINGLGSFRLTDAVRAAYEGKQRRDLLDAAGLRRQRLLEPLQYLAGPKKEVAKINDSYEFPGKTQEWAWWHGYPLMALPWYSGRLISFEDYLCIDPNPQVLSEDLRYLIDSDIMEKIEEGRWFSKKQTFFRIKDTSQWSGPMW